MKTRLVLTVLLAAASTALADVRVGVIVSSTGSAASLGIPEKNTVAMLPVTEFLPRQYGLFL